MATLQETFDIIVAHARKQPVQARESEGMGCRYRTSEGLKCWGGTLIPDEVYKPDFEGRTARDLGGDFWDKLGYDVEFVEYCQLIHDNYSPCDWEQKLKHVARLYGLTYSEPVNG